jgi:pimeloyl-ACP methyl ester carboxylesterase
VREQPEPRLIAAHVLVGLFRSTESSLGVGEWVVVRQGRTDTTKHDQLAIFPNATHMLPYDDPVLFNATVERFLRNPSARKDRIRDLEESLEQLRTAR